MRRVFDVLVWSCLVLVNRGVKHWLFNSSESENKNSAGNYSAKLLDVNSIQKILNPSNQVPRARGIILQSDEPLR